MANLLSLKNRIRSVKNIGQITKAMELVSATKMRKAQQRALDSRAYNKEIESLVTKLVNGEIEFENFSLCKNIKSEKNLLIIIGPSKGLAGPLISNLSREVYKYLVTNPNTDLISLDKKGGYIAERSGKKIIGSMDTLKSNIESDDLSPIYDLVRDSFVNGNYKKVSIAFTHFVNTLTQKPTVLDLLPISFENLSNVEDIEVRDMVIEPNKTKIIEELLNKYFENKLFVSVLDSISSDHSARMIAMKNANENATELKDDLTLEYNQSRQAAITQQILEIAGATAAMEA